MFGTEDAKAHHLLNSPVVNNGQVTTEVWQQLIDNAIRPTTPNAVPQTQVDNLTMRARMGARILPKLQVATGQILLGASAFTLGWAIGSTVYAKLLAPQNDAGGGITGGTWAHTLTAVSATHRNVQASACPTATFPLGCWVWFHHSSTWGDPGEARIPPPDAPTKTGTAATLMNYLRDNQTAVASQVKGHLVDNYRTTGIGPGGCQTVSDWGIGYPAGITSSCLKLITNTPDQMAEKLQIEYSNSTEFNNLPAPQRISTGTYTPPGDLGTTADKQAAAQVIGDGTQHSPDPDIAAKQKATEEAWCAMAGLSDCTPNITMPNCVGLSESGCNSALDAALHTGTRTFVELGIQGAIMTQPAGSVVTQSVGANTAFQPNTALELSVNPDPMPIEIFNPAGNETWDQYLSRLQDAGYVGTVQTPVVLDPSLADPLYGPGVPVRIVVGNPATSTIRFPVATPTLRIPPDEILTPQLNPPTMPEKDPDAPDYPTPDGPGTGVPPGGAPPLPPPGVNLGDCDCPPLDFSPITELDTDGVFPFAIFGWIEDIFTGTGSDAIDFTIGDGTATEQNISLSSSAWETDYRPRVFLVMQFFLTILAIVAVARWGLGLGDHGD